MLKKPFYYLLLLFLVTGCANSVNQPTNKDGQDNKSAEVGLDMELEVDLEMNLEIVDKKDAKQFIIELTNHSANDVILEFSSGQKFDIIVSTEDGKQVYRFSEGRFFTQAFQKQTIQAGKSVKWLDTWKYDKQITPGNYKVTAKIVAITINDGAIEKDQLTVSKDFTIEEKQSAIQDNDAFRNIVVDESGSTYTITGEARVYEGVFQYEVNEDGTVIHSGVETVPEGAPSWSPFSFTVDLSNTNTSNGNVEISLFVYSANDGSKINIISIPVQ